MRCGVRTLLLVVGISLLMVTGAFADTVSYNTTGSSLSCDGVAPIPASAVG